MVTLMLVSCVTEQAPKVEPSGFLSDYSILQPGQRGEAMLVYKNPEAVFVRYQRILLKPVRAWRSADSQLDRVPEQDIQRLVNLLHIEVAQALAKNFQLVGKPGPGTLTIEIALTEAAKSNVPADVVSTLVPIGRGVSTLDRLVTGTYGFVGGAGVEGKITDSTTGELLLAAVDRRGGGKALSGVLRSWDDVEEAFRVWAERIRKRLLEEGLQANWDQAKVMHLAKDFEKAVAALLLKARIEKREVSETDSDAEYLIVQDLRLLRRHSQRYARALSARKGRLETTPVFLRLMEIVRSARSQVQGTDILADAQAEIDAARKILGEIAGYYGESLPPPVSRLTPGG
jgi:hypothetical protein